MICENKKSVQFHNRLPYEIRSAGKRRLEAMEKEINEVCRQVVYTSGFRSPGSNKYWGGKINSLHCYYSAIDVRIGSISLAERKALERKGYQVIRSKNCWHIQTLKDF